MIKNKTVLITGASTGIGFECAKKFISNNYNVISHFFEKNNNLNYLSNFANNESLYCDFRDEKSLKDFLNKIKEKDIEILINNAGAFDFSKNEGNRINNIKNVLSVNLIAPVMIIETVVEKMKQKECGHILNISSIGSKYGSNSDNIFYGITKRGIESSAKSFARELAKYNILVNSIRPGVTNTDFYKKLGKNIDQRINLIPLKRAMEPDELAKYIFFMCTENTYITNEIITIAGGE